MAHADFVHLRVHSAYSLSEGAIRSKALVGLCRERRMPAVAVTDTANMFGAMEFCQAAAGAGVQPIIGTLLPLARRDRPNGAGHAGLAPAPDHIVLLAQDETGYQNLMALLSRAYLGTAPGEPPQLDLDVLATLSQGLIALTGGPSGTVGRLLADGHDTAAEETLLGLRQTFPGRLYVELMRHGLEVEERIEPGLIDLAYRHDLPLVATNDAFFAGADMYDAHDALLCIAEGTYVAERDRRRLTPEHRFKSAEEMRALFADLPEAVDNTMVIARRCHVMAPERKPILPAFPTAEGRSEEEELRAQAETGLEARLPIHAYTPDMDEAARIEAARPYRERLDYELGVIMSMGFAGYFLIVADFIQWAKAEGIPVGPGRGSGAGSVVAWSLTITDLDPLRFGLLFERFLNPERVSMPDFDIDFCQDRRDEVIRYVADKFGHDRVAQIITFGKLQARAVLRDVGRVLQMPYGQVDRLCKLVPNNPASPVTLQQAIEGEPQLQEMRRSDETVGHLIDIALKLEGLYRHASTHAAGVVIGDRPLDQLVPLYRDPRSPMPVTQFNMKHVEQAGLVKFDFLGLKTLTVLARTLDLIVSAGGIAPELEKIPLDDAATFEMLGRGDTVGVFQLESAGMRDVLRRMKPNRFEDIIALVALYRPGPMDNIPKYVKVKLGEEKPDYLHPTLRPILEETFGIMIYQEQVMQVAQVLAGYSLGGADLLRRAMGKKIQSEMDAQKKAFVDGAMARGVAKAQASMIFDQVNKFAGYGFNKSHAAAYALVAYQTAYFKANHPVAFLAASMTLDIHNTDKLNTFRQEVDRLHIALLPPSS
ncbi:MAG: DNA polymerase III subunit alpha, partial [Inquilinus sp.]|nr:DNA polymerase III subunit alpha [Inquilinus sp.]